MSSNRVNVLSTFLWVWFWFFTAVQKQFRILFHFEEFCWQHFSPHKRAQDIICTLLLSSIFADTGVYLNRVIFHEVFQWKMCHMGREIRYLLIYFTILVRNILSPRSCPYRQHAATNTSPHGKRHHRGNPKSQLVTKWDYIQKRAFDCCSLGFHLLQIFWNRHAW